MSNVLQFVDAALDAVVLTMECLVALESHQCLPSLTARPLGGWVNQAIASFWLKRETKHVRLRLIGANESFDVTTRTEPPFPRPASTRPEHQATGRHYPGEWARQFELYLDRGPRRVVFYAALFGAFVAGVVISAIVSFGS